MLTRMFTKILLGNYDFTWISLGFYCDVSTISRGFSEDFDREFEGEVAKLEQRSSNLASSSQRMQASSGIGQVLSAGYAASGHLGIPERRARAPLIRMSLVLDDSAGSLGFLEFLESLENS